MPEISFLDVIDSHTGGEPTRVILDGAILLAGATMPERRDDFAARFDHIRRAVIHEPRGSDVLVGAILTPPVRPESAYGVIFFNNAGYLGMCGHGTIGVVETLRHEGRIGPGIIQLDTPAGPVSATLHESGEVTIGNVLSYRYQTHMAVEIEGVGTVVGDVAYGGNWFFVVHQPVFEISLTRRQELLDVTTRIRHALEMNGITGAAGAEIDHIELTGPGAEGADSRNFVLCPGGAYDRSPCGTGTSAKMACLYAAGDLASGQTYVQESVTGSRFFGTVEAAATGEGVHPTITGRAFITGESRLHFRPDDPLCWGMA